MKLLVHVIPLLFALGARSAMAIGASEGGVEARANNQPPAGVVVLPVEKVQRLQGNATEYVVNNELALFVDEEKKLCAELPHYNPQTSNSSREDGVFQGETVYMDNVYIGNVTPEKFHFITDKIADPTKDRLNDRSGTITVHESLDDRNGTGIIGLSARNFSVTTALVGQGAIDSHVYGLSLGTSKCQGSLVFGGFDSKKYKCRLDKFGSGDFYLTSIGFSLLEKPYKFIDVKNDTWPKGAPNVILYQGLQASALPTRLLHAIGDSFPGAQHVDLGLQEVYTVPCDQSLEGTIDFAFNNVTTISVPWSDFVVHDSPNQGQCGLAMYSNEDWQVPGSALLEHMYTFIDFDNDEGWIGQSDDCGSNIVSVNKGKNTFPIVDGCNCKGYETS